MHKVLISEKKENKGESEGKREDREHGEWLNSCLEVWRQVGGWFLGVQSGGMEKK